ncbi:formate dehydrogenase accessory sulfurtransferase FdhD [Undibacterium sp. TJN19]|uniref:formate dehydrogenase accessory sulfurtransferase FdhD n=1 Tax=Undibacterium sp. TJN19 TaxID=3413055 RepID=UPI003BF0EC2C
MRRAKINSAQDVKPASRSLQVQRHGYDAALPVTIADQVAEEMPVALVYNGISHAVMMVTPVDLEDFAIGFSLSEQIVAGLDDIYSIEYADSTAASGMEIHLHIAASCFARLKERRRNLSGNTGCGLCGLESLQALELHQPASVDKTVIAGQKLSKAALFQALQGLNAQQPINAMTGAMHAAAWVDMQGHIVSLREDVGRHNALDKLIGALSQPDKGAGKSGAGFVLLSSRASYELVQKAARANIAILAALSAPTALAIDVAERAGICLIGFVRQHGFVAYTHTAYLLTE